MQRHTIELKDWRFQIDHDEIGESKVWFNSDYDRSGWTVAEVPRAWDFYGEHFRGYEGVGWFAAEIKSEYIHPELLQKIVFDSVSGYSKVWINGSYLGDNLGSYLPF